MCLYEHALTGVCVCVLLLCPQLATSKGLISGDLCYMEEDGTRIDCRSSSAVSSLNNLNQLKKKKRFYLYLPKTLLISTLNPHYEILSNVLRASSLPLLLLFLSHFVNVLWHITDTNLPPTAVGRNVNHVTL